MAGTSPAMTRGESTGHAVSQLQQPRYAGEGLPADRGFLRDPPPPGLRLLQLSLHHVRARANELGHQPGRIRRRGAAMRLHALGAMGIASLLLMLHQQPADGAEINVMYPPPLRSVLSELIPQFERASGHKASVTYESSW